MNTFTCTVLFALIASVAIASPIPEANIENNNQAAAAEELTLIEHELELENIARNSRNVGSSYGAPAAKSYTYPSPAPHVPCGKNLLFSCSPYVAPVPCSAPHYGHGGGEHYGSAAGAYSEYIPQYMLPEEGHYYHQ